MNKLNKILKAGVFAAFLAAVIAGPVMAADYSCITGGTGKYPNLSTSGGAGTEYPNKCVTINDGGNYITIYGKDAGACAQAGSLTSDPDDCNSQDLNEIIHTIINTVIFVVGMLAVIMIILGGVNYATSQGDPNKVNKAKSTIMYGIIGLVICLLAFAIVNFVLQALA